MAPVTFKLSLLLFTVWTIQAISSMPASSDEYNDAVEITFGVSEIDNAEELIPREVCVMPMKRGHCRALLLRWIYDPETKTCKEFKYGGCAGNANNFLTRKDCIKMCQGI